MKNQSILAINAMQMGLRSEAQHVLYYPGCSETITDPSNSDCPVKELGDIRGYALVKQDFTFTDITATSEWTTGINARDIYVFNLGRGGLEVSPVESPGFGDEDVTTDGLEFNATIYDPQYKANHAFWNSVFRNKTFKLAYKTETQIHLSDKVVSITATAPITEGDKKTAVLWRLQFKWSQDDNPTPNDAPTGVFDQAIAL